MQYRCSDCKMVFDDAKLFNKHREKFCLQSGYSQIETLIQLQFQHQLKSKKIQQPKSIINELTNQRQKDLKQDLMEFIKKKEEMKHIIQQKQQQKGQEINRKLINVQNERKKLQQIVRNKEAQFKKNQITNKKSFNKYSSPQNNQQSHSPISHPTAIKQLPKFTTNYRQYANKMISELENLKADYLQNGYSDPIFLRKLTDLTQIKQPETPDQLILEQQSQRKKPISQKQKLQMQRETNEKVQKKDRMSQFNNQQINPIKLDFNHIKQQYQKKLSQMQYQQNEINQYLTKKKNKKQKQSTPWHQINPSNQGLLLGSLNYNHHLDQEQNILIQLMRQEVDQLRILEKLQGTKLWTQAFSNYKQMTRIRANLQQKILDAQQVKCQLQYQSNKNTKKRDLQNAKWVDQKRKYIIESNYKLRQ